MKKRFGFTLAEVLIALTIIGVVAALTAPRFIGNATKKQFTAKFKTTMNLLDSAAKEFKTEEGGFDYKGNRAEFYGSKNITRILHDKIGASLVLDQGDNKTSKDWQVEGILHSGTDSDKDPETNVGVFTNRKTALQDTTCENDEDLLTLSSGTRTAYIPFGCSRKDSETENIYKTLKLNNGAYIYLESNVRGCGYNGALWNNSNNTYDALTGSSSHNLCLAFIDVNGAKGPNKLTTCVGDTKMIFPGAVATCDYEKDNDGNPLSTMSFASVGDVFPVWFYDDSVAPANTAANSVWLDSYND